MIKLLVADDEAIERKMLVSILEKEFSTEAMVRVAENGRQAVEIAAIWNPDVVLIDIEMPGINGIDAARRILDQQAGTKIIFVTAYGVFTYAQEAVKLGPATTSSSLPSPRRWSGRSGGRPVRRKATASFRPWRPRPAGWTPALPGTRPRP